MRYLYCKRVFDINPSGGKKIVAGLQIRAGKCIPTVVIVSDKAEFWVDVKSWNEIMENRENFESFFERRTDVLEMKLDTPHFKTSITGKPGDLNLVGFYQTPMGSDKDRYMFLAKVTSDKLFAIRRLVDHYFELLEKSMPELEEFLALYHKQRNAGTAINYETKFTSVGISLSMLYHELACYERNFYN